MDWTLGIFEEPPMIKICSIFSFVILASLKTLSRLVIIVLKISEQISSNFSRVISTDKSSPL